MMVVEVEVVVYADVDGCVVEHGRSCRLVGCVLRSWEFSLQRGKTGL